MAAMVTHAAGESAALFDMEAYKFGPPTNPVWPNFFSGATAVVLEVKDEVQLLKAALMLSHHEVKYLVVNESSPQYDGQAMAIGLMPAERSVVGPLLTEYQTLKKLEPLDDDTCSCSNCRVRLDKPEEGA
jgi:hypothetical protein